ncbi:MAG TPA: IscS subfamily cysteine desulfurase, partial [Polyangiaceae bacterium]
FPFPFPLPFPLPLRYHAVPTNMTEAIYLDHHATTPVDGRVLEAMLPYFTQEFGNAASRSHGFGWRANAAVEDARATLANALGARGPKEILFTSGATESNNLAIKGAAEYLRERGRHLVTTRIEHKSVLDTMKRLETQGFEVTYVDVDREGRVDPERIAEALRPDTTLCSVMLANNEVGTIEPIHAIGRITRERGVLLHVDACQGFQRTPLHVIDDNVDLCSITAHKIYGPKGIGALYVRSAQPRVRLVAQIDGGGHERGMRSGTLNVPGIVGFAKAVELMLSEGAEENARIAALRDRLETRLLAELDHVSVNGSRSHRLPGNLNLSFHYVEGESLMLSVREIALSSGSACTSASLEPSYVLAALGVDAAAAHSSIRFGLGRANTAEQIDSAATRVIAAVRRLRELSPLYEMVQNGVDLSQINWNHG